MPFKKNEIKYHSFKFIIDDDDVSIYDRDEPLNEDPVIWDVVSTIANTTLLLSWPFPKSNILDQDWYDFR